MPEHVSALRFAAEETCTENHVRPPLADEFVEVGKFGRIVFQIRVLYDDHVAPCHRQPGRQRRSFAPIARVKQEADPVFRSEFVQNPTSAIRAAVVHDDQFQMYRHRQNPRDDLLHRIAFVEAGHQHGQQWLYFARGVPLPRHVASSRSL